MRKLGFLVMLVYLGLGSLAASAQIELKITLPFAFQAGDTSFNAGAYRIEQESPNRKLTIRAEKGKQSGVFATTSLYPEPLSKPETTWLLFHRYGQKYFLSEVWSKHIGREMPLSEEEKKLRDSGAEMVPVKVNVKG